MRASAQAVLAAPIDRIDVHRRLFSLSDDEYRAAARSCMPEGLLVPADARSSVAT